MQQQWSLRRFDIEKGEYFAEVPTLHIHIEALFSLSKTLLDLLTQLLSSERVVTSGLDGFHRNTDKNGVLVYGGRVINALSNNVVSTRKALAHKLLQLISEHKGLWIDEVIEARDWFIHRERGVHQLMFQLQFAEVRGSLVCTNISPPVVGSLPVDQYAKQTLDRITAFASSLLALLREGH